jgi:hypothetical protein
MSLKEYYEYDRRRFNKLVCKYWGNGTPYEEAYDYACEEYDGKYGDCDYVYGEKNDHIDNVISTVKGNYNMIKTERYNYMDRELYLFCNQPEMDIKIFNNKNKLIKSFKYQDYIDCIRYFIGLKFKKTFRIKGTYYYFKEDYNNNLTSVIEMEIYL